MPSSLRSLLRAAMPGFVKKLRSRAYERAEARRHAAEKRLHAALGGRVVSGPFAGMHHAATNWWGTLGPALLGTYELELVPAIESIIAAGCQRFIDIGAGEGHYAAGLLMRLPTATGLAYEADPEGQALMRQTALANGVADRLEIRGHCGPADLASALETFGPDLIICDIEGAERDLLDAEAIPRLAEIDLLVEIHDFVDPTTGITLERRFRSTHVIERIAARPRKAAEVPAVAGFTRAERLLLASEQRPHGMEWLWMRPNR